VNVVLNYQFDIWDCTVTDTKKGSLCHTRRISLPHNKALTAIQKVSYCHTTKLLLSHNKALTTTQQSSYCHTRLLCHKKDSYCHTKRFLLPYKALTATKKALTGRVVCNGYQSRIEFEIYTGSEEVKQKYFRDSTHSFQGILAQYL
jgi:hypothetical protein